MSQTPWLIKEQETGTNIESVQTSLGEAIRKEIFGADEVLLHGSGREDLDVRMVGQGRPFILEFINPHKGVTCYKRISEMSSIANSQSNVVKALDMQIATMQDFDELKASCNTKAKAYVSIVWVKDKLTQ